MDHSLHHAVEGFGYFAAFMTGLLGSGHCLGMCGSLVCGYFIRARAAGSGRLNIAPYLAYHGARISVYGVVGLIAAALGAVLVSTGQIGLAQGVLHIATSDNRFAVASAVFVGGGIGSPIVGVFVAWLTGIVDYKSPTGVEWGVAGVTSALLVSWLFRLPLAPTVVLSAMWAVSAILVHHTVLALFEDEPKVGRITPRSAAIYCVDVLVTSGGIYLAFKVVESVID